MSTIAHRVTANSSRLSVQSVLEVLCIEADFQLDDEVNPDPFHELPPPPPVRPRAVDSDHGRNPFAHNQAHDQGPPGNFIQQLMGGLFGAAVDPHGQHGHDHEGDGVGRGVAPPADRQGRGQQGGGGGMRTFQFNIGGGNASVSFGSMGGGMGPFGPAGPAGQDDRGLEEWVTDASAVAAYLTSASSQVSGHRPAPMLEHSGIMILLGRSTLWGRTTRWDLRNS